MTQRLSHEFVARFRGEEDAKLWSSFLRPDVNLIGQSARELLASVPPSFGSCAMLSATWAAYLRERYNVPAVAVAGDLALGNVPVFVCERNLPDGEGTGLQDFGEWNGHCWIEVGGYVGDLSLFRSAYAVKPTHYLAQFVSSRFGKGRGAIVFPIDDLEEMAMQYKPKYVLTDPQINALWAGLMHVISNDGSQVNRSK